MKVKTFIVDTPVYWKRVLRTILPLSALSPFLQRKGGEQKREERERGGRGERGEGKDFMQRSSSRVCVCVSAGACVLGFDRAGVQCGWDRRSGGEGGHGEGDGDDADDDYDGAEG